MIKFVIAAVWIVAVTVGSIMFAASSAKESSKEPTTPAPFFGGLDYVKTDVLSVPVLKGNAVQGYFLARLVYTVDPQRAAAMSVPLDVLLTDAVFSYLFGNPLIDFTRTDKLDLDSLRNGVRDAVNARVGEELVNDILLEQVDYLSKIDIRDNNIRRRAGKPQAPADGAEAAARPAAH